MNCRHINVQIAILLNSLIYLKETLADFSEIKIITRSKMIINYLEKKLKFQT